MNNVIKKFEMMYKLGVRSFAVFFDDIFGEGKRGDMQALLLNKINNEFVKVKKDVTPLVMCPTEYNRRLGGLQAGNLPGHSGRPSGPLHPRHVDRGTPSAMTSRWKASSG